MLLQDDRQITQKQSYDVVVVGGGIAGIAAAVAAARGGAKTLLMEKQINLGGLATVGLISWYEPLCDGNGKQMIYGIGEELIKLSIKYGFDNLHENWGGKTLNTRSNNRYATFYSPMIFSVALDEYVRENGVDLRFDTYAVYPVMDGKRCLGIMTETVSGREFYPAKVVIDATGDATVCHRAGMPTVNGENKFVYVSHGFSKQELEDYDDNKDLFELRKWHWVNGKGFDTSENEGIADTSGTTSDSVNDFIKLGKQKTLEMVKSHNKGDYELWSIPTMPQFRMIRHIVGEHTFYGTEDGVNDIADSVGCFSDFRKSGPHFQLPYSTLYNKEFPNILAAGRIISAEGEGWQITRVIPICALSGQAAGTAAAMCAKSDTAVGALDITKLQNALKEEKIILNF